MRRRILIVDHDPNYREILKALLESRGYRVTALEDGSQLGALVDRGAFDIIFLDSETPGIRGKALCATIKKACPRSYIILITSRRGNGFIKEAMDTGAYGCVAKPFHPDEILTMVNQLIGRDRHITVGARKPGDAPPPGGNQ